MSRIEMLGTAAALAIVGGVAAAQTGVTNILGDFDEVIAGAHVALTPGGHGIRSEQSYSLLQDSARLTDSWAFGGRYVGPESAEDTGTLTLFLGSPDRTDLNEAWTLFLADLDFGQQGTLAQWGLIGAGIPEPTAWALFALGGLAVGTHLLRRRSSSQRSA